MIDEWVKGGRKRGWMDGVKDEWVKDGRKRMDGVKDEWVKDGRKKGWME